MQLTRKSLLGSFNSFSLVDQFLTQQGFRRTTKMGEPVYNMKMEDSATKSTYFIIIPLKMDKVRKNHHSCVRFGNPYLAHTPDQINVPLSIKQAAEHKLAEIADYLKTSMKKNTVY